MIDAVDKCPDQPEDPDGFQDEDGCPDPDNDGDARSSTSTTTAPKTSPVLPAARRSGCPKKENQLVVVTGANEIRILQQVHFAFNKATILKDSFKLLDSVADVLRESSGMRIEVQGHTDNVGDVAYNMKLSQARSGGGAEVPREPRHRGRSPHSQRIRRDAADRPQRDRGEPRTVNRRVQFIRTESRP